MDQPFIKHGGFGPHGHGQVPASRLLLAAACPSLTVALKASPQALHWEVSPEVARAIVVPWNGHGGWGSKW